MKSCLYEGQVRHRRFAPRVHNFRYRVFYCYLDLDEIDHVFSGRWFWSTRVPALAWFNRADYLGKDDVSLKTAVLDRVEQETGIRPAGPIRMLAHLRYFGFVFNPVTFYYCFDKSDSHVETIVAEITNTPWGERYAYVLPVGDDAKKSRHMKFEMDKDFHVSPFMPMDIRYNWFFTTPEERLNVHMVNYGQDKKVFDATLTMERKSISSINCASVLVRYPFMTTKVIVGIYWQALRLILKRIPFFNHPNNNGSQQTGDAKEAKLS